jgi:hypothetical protein
MNKKNFIENQNDGKLPLNQDGRKPKWLHNKTHDPTTRVTKMTYVIVHNPTTRMTTNKHRTKQTNKQTTTTEN